jgi:hypothetical protein
MVRLEEALMVILFAVAVAPMIGLLVTLGITTSSPEPATVPDDQLLAVAQSVLVAPVHVFILGTVNIPDEAAK